MHQPIVGFHQDEQRHWVADLACGHAQHLRHDPPWQERPWVLDAAARKARLGTTLNCVLCDEGAPPAHLSPAAAEAYADARIQGLCHEGAIEIAKAAEAKPRPSC